VVALGEISNLRLAVEKVKPGPPKFSIKTSGWENDAHEHDLFEVRRALIAAEAVGDTSTILSCLQTLIEFFAGIARGCEIARAYVGVAKRSRMVEDQIAGQWLLGQALLAAGDLAAAREAIEWFNGIEIAGDPSFRPRVRRALELIDSREGIPPHPSVIAEAIVSGQGGSPRSALENEKLAGDLLDQKETGTARILIFEAIAAHRSIDDARGLDRCYRALASAVQIDGRQSQVDRLLKKASEMV
jgi:hypothetical protein